MRSLISSWVVCFGLFAASCPWALGCDDDSSAPVHGSRGSSQPEPEPTSRPATPPVRHTEPAIADSLPNGLLITYAQFAVENGQVASPIQPGASRVEILRRRNGAWETTAFEDPSSTVIHKAMPYNPPHGEPGILTASGMSAAVKLWRLQDGEYQSETLWSAQFGPTNSRMRDIEVADLYGDGTPDIAVATHDQGVFAIIRPQEDGTYQVTRMDQQDNTVLHEVEIGDLNGDGTLEVYVTRSEPNRVRSDEHQAGEVVRYVPSLGQGRTVVATFNNRHAKEIYVGDVDGDGRDELYVSVEALTGGEHGSEIVEPVEIRRYDYDTPPDQGIVIARIRDRMNRFLTVGDIDGDGKKEMVAAAFRSGLWLLRPGSNPRGEWSIESIDRQSSGFEHAATITDLDGDGVDELYVASDEQGELRRYVWVNGRPRRTVIHRRTVARSMLTWNIVAIPTP